MKRITSRHGSQIYLYCMGLISMGLILSCGVIGKVPPTLQATKTSFLLNPTSTNEPINIPTVVIKPTLGMHDIWRNSRIAFSSNRDGNFQIYIMNPDGSNLTRLTDSKGTNSYPAWSMDAKHVAFASTRDGNSEIYIMNPDGSDQKNLTRDPSNDYSPIWLPNNRIAFISNRKGRERIFVMDMDGKNIRSFGSTSVDSTSSIICLTWLSEGVISFSTREVDKVEVFITDTATGESWRPDLFTGEHERACPLMAALVQDRWDIFVDYQNDQSQIYKYDSKSDLDVQMTSLGSSNLGPSRSADESWITYYSNRTGNWDIFVMGVDGSPQWNITQDPGDDIQPVWEP
jgi:Tol biopolymer transport system component